MAAENSKSQIKNVYRHYKEHLYFSNRLQSFSISVVKSAEKM